jgi:DUF1680 family protein
LASLGKQSRKEWFGTACCPSNIARLIASLGNFIYGYAENKIFINLFVGSQTSFTLPNGEIQFNMQTNYPWSGDVKCTLSMKKKLKTAIAFRIPGWSKGIPAPGELYSFSSNITEKPIMMINNVEVPFTEENGYAIIERDWKNNDVIEYKIPMSIKKVMSRNELKYNNERIAIQRGPLVWCAEEADNGPDLHQFRVTVEGARVEAGENLGPGARRLRLSAVRRSVEPSKTAYSTKRPQDTVTDVVLVPYHLWGNRGKGEMRVWLGTKFG